MLAELRIQGLGVIDDAALELHPGLTVVTGETGAGKTMVVTGLHLLCGGRGDASRVRIGEPRAVVEGRFDLTGADPAVAAAAADAGARLDEDGSLIAVRSVAADGRSRAHLGGRAVPVAVLGELGEALLAVHGQHEALRLLRPAEQRAVLDRFAGPAAQRPLERYRAARSEWQAARAELVRRRDGARELAREADLLRHGLAEVEALAPRPGEDRDLVAEARRLADADDLRATALAAQHAVAGGDAAEGGAEPGALGLVGQARRRLAGSSDEALRVLEPRLVEAVALLADVGAELSGYLDALAADPLRLETVLARQAELKTLTRKYAADIDGVLGWAEQAQRRLAGLDTSEEAVAAVAARRDELAGELARHAAALSAARQDAATRLGAAVTAELAGLAMPQAALAVAVVPRPAADDDPAVLRVDGHPVQAGPDGVEDVELRLVAHRGGPALPVHKGASGGELSRVMLAVEVVLADADPVRTLVFDEVDAGVGGRAAVEVGRRLARLARSHQVVVVTHLPQVAAYADRHLVVDKSARGAGIRAGVRQVSSGERVAELARMLAGAESSSTGRAHAEELLAVAAADKAPRREQDPGPAAAGQRRRAG